MLNHLRARAEQAFSTARTVILTSCGPAGLQADSVLCQGEDLRLYLLVPRTSDQLLNLEQAPAILLITPNWKLRGTARVLPAAETPAHLSQAAERSSAWSVWVEVQPVQLQRLDGNGNSIETIDFSIFIGG